MDVTLFIQTNTPAPRPGSNDFSRALALELALALFVLFRVTRGRKSPSSTIKYIHD